MVDHDELDMSRVPVLVILGATGSGKSRLGIELAQKFCGEIISADSMQVYKSLDIITAKVTSEERKMARHHMLDVVDPLTEFTVCEFRKMALPIIDDILARKKMPIIVGGTNYYIESLIWKVLMNHPTPVGQSDSDSINERVKSDAGLREGLSKGDIADEPSPSKRMKVDIRSTEETNEELLQRLMQVDPVMARRLHPNNRRKIIRSLEVFEQYGVPHSELLKVQRLEGGSGLGGPLRYPNSVILWLYCDRAVLHERLNQRVDRMVEAGLLQELLDFHRKYNEQRIETNSSPDYTKGIFQSIGFKEFHAYLVLPDEEKKSERGQKLLQQGIEDLKLVTRRYARRQEKWVNNRIIRRADRQVPPVYTLDCTDLEQWNSRVFEPAVSILSAILRGEKPEQAPATEEVSDKKTTDSSNDEIRYCEVCERFLSGETQWITHINGVRHAKVAKKKKRMEKMKSQEQQSAQLSST